MQIAGFLPSTVSYIDRYTKLLWFPRVRSGVHIAWRQGSQADRAKTARFWRHRRGGLPLGGPAGNGKRRKLGWCRMDMDGYWILILCWHKWEYGLLDGYFVFLVWRKVTTVGFYKCWSFQKSDNWKMHQYFSVTTCHKRTAGYPRLAMCRGWYVNGSCEIPRHRKKDWMYLNTRIRENQENMRYMDVNEAMIISTYFNILACVLCSNSEHEAYIHHHSITPKTS